MTTNDKEKIESTVTTENTATDNKKVFSPLGKYAAVAVIMVSIIVTTAILLNKQLGSVEEQLAAMENEVAEIHATDSTGAATSEANEAATEAQEAAIETVETESVAVEVQTAEVQAVEAPSADVLVATENTAKDTATKAITSTEQTSVSETAEAVIEPAMGHDSAEENLAQLDMDKRDQERQARIEAFKLEQKQHMTEMFARIKKLEAQRLDEYKTIQDERVERLRQQIAKQEEMIDALILRNKEWIEMREASMQRSQSNREKMLERI